MSKKKVPTGMPGFTEILDMAEEKKEAAPFKGKEGYAIYSFLENEQKRLEALDELFSKKYMNLKRHPQTEKLLLNEVYKRNLLKEDLFDKLKYTDSPMNKHLEQIFNSAFK
ncbi:MAG: hypothetical protein ACJAT2_001352 [Bacteriovoracaceae bacterium]